MKKNLKKIIALTMSAIFLMSTMACTDNKNDSADKKPERDYVYVPEYKELDTDSYSMDVMSGDGKIYFTANTYDDENSKSTTYIYSVDTTGEQIDKIQLDLPNEASVMYTRRDKDGNFVMMTNEYYNSLARTDEYTKSEEATGNTQEYVGEDNEAEATENVQESVMEGATEATEDAQEYAGEDNAAENGSMAEYDADYIDKYYIIKFDSQGKEIYKKDINEILQSQEGTYYQYLELDGDGRIVLTDTDNTLIVLDNEANFLFNIENKNYINSMGTTGDGKIIVAGWSDDSNDNEVRLIDMDTKALSEPVQNIPNNMGSYKFIPYEGNKTLISSGNTLYLFDFSNNTSEEILNWLESDIDADMLNGISYVEDGKLAALYKNYDEPESKLQMVLLTKTKRSDIKEKKELVYATLYLSQEMKQAVINFNKNSDEYRIRVEEYYSDDYETSLAKFNSELAIGNSFDIVDVSSANIDSYASKGIFENLYDYMDKDSQVNREDYFENILKLYEKDGKLYAMPQEVRVELLTGKKSIVGEDLHWTLDELIDTYHSMPQGSKLFDTATCDNVLFTLGGSVINDMIDWEKGECHFDSEEFIKLLEFAHEFPTGSEIEYADELEEEAEIVGIKNGTTMLMDCYMLDTDEIQVHEKVIGDDLAYKGYPCKEGNGVMAGPANTVLSISSKSKNKEAAWEFVKYFIMPKQQENLYSWSFPILKSAFKNRMEEKMKPQYYLENGEKTEAFSTYSFGNNLEIEIGAASQENVDKLEEMIMSIDKLSHTDTKIYTIIQEEAAAYFDNKKTAKEVADIIQSRVAIYVKETR